VTPAEVIGLEAARYGRRGPPEEIRREYGYRVGKLWLVAGVRGPCTTRVTLPSEGALEVAVSGIAPPFGCNAITP
jgi:hypothetical protein